MTFSSLLLERIVSIRLVLLAPPKNALHCNVIVISISSHLRIFYPRIAFKMALAILAGCNLEPHTFYGRRAPSCIGCAHSPLSTESPLEYLRCMVATSRYSHQGTFHTVGLHGPHSATMPTAGWAFLIDRDIRLPWYGRFIRTCTTL